MMIDKEQLYDTFAQIFMIMIESESDNMEIAFDFKCANVKFDVCIKDMKLKGRKSKW